MITYTLSFVVINVHCIYLIYLKLTHLLRLGDSSVGRADDSKVKPHILHGVDSRRAVATAFFNSLRKMKRLNVFQIIQFHLFVPQEKITCFK